MNECIDSPLDELISSTLDGKCHYSQMELYNADCDKTVFTSHDGSWNFPSVPFEHGNATWHSIGPQTHFSPVVQWQLALMYLEDIITFLQTAHEHIEHVSSVLIAAAQTGRHVEREGVQAVPKKHWLLEITDTSWLELYIHTTDTVCSSKLPLSVAELKSVLCLWKTYWSFIPNFARTAASVSARLKKKEPKQLNDLSSAEMDSWATFPQKLTCTSACISWPRRYSFSRWTLRRWIHKMDECWCRISPPEQRTPCGICPEALT